MFCVVYTEFFKRIIVEWEKNLNFRSKELWNEEGDIQNHREERDAESLSPLGLKWLN